MDILEPIRYVPDSKPHQSQSQRNSILNQVLLKKNKHKPQAVATDYHKKNKINNIMIRIRDCSEFLVRGVVHLLGGYPFLTRFPRCGTKILRTLRGVYPFLHTQKKEAEDSKIPLSRNSPAARDALFMQFAPAALKSFRYP